MSSVDMTIRKSLERGTMRFFAILSDSLSPVPEFNATARMEMFKR